MKNEIQFGINQTNCIVSAETHNRKYEIYYILKRNFNDLIVSSSKRLSCRSAALHFDNTSVDRTFFVIEFLQNSGGKNPSRL